MNPSTTKRSTTNTPALPSDDEIAEWVGLHYRVHFDTEPADRKRDWRERYIEMHADA